MIIIVVKLLEKLKGYLILAYPIRIKLDSYNFIEVWTVQRTWEAGARLSLQTLQNILIQASKRGLMHDFSSKQGIPRVTAVIARRLQLKKT